MYYNNITILTVVSPLLCVVSSMLPAVEKIIILNAIYIKGKAFKQQLHCNFSKILHLTSYTFRSH